MLQKVNVIRTDNDATASCDVLERSDKRLKVAFPGTTTALTLSRSDVRRAYVGVLFGIEFTSRG